VRKPAAPRELLTEDRQTPESQKRCLARQSPARTKPLRKWASQRVTTERDRGSRSTETATDGRVDDRISLDDESVGRVSGSPGTGKGVIRVSRLNQAARTQGDAGLELSNWDKSV
jgi:hypothetical protein